MLRAEKERRALGSAAALALTLVSPLNGEEAPPEDLRGRLVDRRCLVTSYVGSYRRATFEHRDDVRHPVTTYIEGNQVRYATQKRLIVPLERKKRRSLEDLAWYDDRLRERPSLRGFSPGDVAIVQKVEVKDDELELRVEGERGDERRGKVVVKLEEASTDPAPYLARLWRVLLPAPPWPSAREEDEALGSVIHGMELWRLAAWLNRPPEEVMARVAATHPPVSGLDVTEQAALRDCYRRVYPALSDRSRIALLELTPIDEYGDTVLTARARPHLPILGDWLSDAARAHAAFDWTSAKVARALPRRCPELEVDAYEVIVDYEYRAQNEWGWDHLESLLPAEEVRAYAELEITTRQVAGRSEHQLNGLPLSLGDKR